MAVLQRNLVMPDVLIGHMVAYQSHREAEVAMMLLLKVVNEDQVVASFRSMVRTSTFEDTHDYVAMVEDEVRDIHSLVLQHLARMLVYMATLA